MTSANFHISYASVTNALFEHIEQDLLILTTALLDDDEELPALHPRPQNVVPAQAGTQVNMICRYVKRCDYSSRLGFPPPRERRAFLGFPPARERRAYGSGIKGT